MKRTLSEPRVETRLLALCSILFLLQARAEQSVEAWARHYGAGSAANAVAVDGSGNAYVAGPAVGSDGVVYEFATVAYSSSGVPLWTNRYRGPGNDHRATAVAVDGSGHVYVTGFSRGSGGYYDYATVAYSSAGVGLWTNRYDGPAGYDDYPQAVAADGSGHAYVTGWARGSGTGWDYGTITYSSAGMPLWTNLYNGPLGYGDDLAQALAVDGSGNL